MKNIYLNEETTRKLLEILGIQESQPTLAPKLADPPVVIVIEAMNIFPTVHQGREDNWEDEDDCEEDAHNCHCSHFEADEDTECCIHCCPECGTCLWEFDVEDC